MWCSMCQYLMKKTHLGPSKLPLDSYSCFQSSESSILDWKKPPTFEHHLSGVLGTEVTKGGSVRGKDQNCRATKHACPWISSIRVSAQHLGLLWWLALTLRCCCLFSDKTPAERLRLCMWHAVIFFHLFPYRQTYSKRTRHYSMHF